MTHHPRPELFISNPSERVSACVRPSVRVSLRMSFEGPAGGVGRSVGCGVGSCSLNGFVRHDPGRKLLLSLLKTGTGGTIQRVHLEREEEEEEFGTGLRGRRLLLNL